MPLFWGAAPFDYPRQRWTGSEKTFRAIGVPCCAHDLELLVFNQFRLDLGEPGVDLEAMLAGVPGAAAAALALPAVDGAAGEPAGDDVVVGPAVVAADGVEPNAVPFDQLPKKNLQHRTEGLQWLASNPGGLWDYYITANGDIQFCFFIFK